MAAQGLDHAWPVATIAMVAVARSCSHEEGRLSRRDRKLLADAEGCAKPRHEQEREGQFCYSSDQHAIDLGPKF
jgi:hypothetical protein